LPVASYSIGAPFIRTKDKLTLGGKAYRVQGEAWFNKEWGSGLLAEGQQGWDQFALRLEDGRTLMVNQYRHIRQPSYTQVTSRCRIQSLIFCSSSRKRTQRNDPSFPSSLTKKWDRIWAPKGEFN
jgi:predicted secreted hydrolase